MINLARPRAILFILVYTSTMFWHTFIPRLISMILSWLDQANLRDRMYRQSQRIEILETALDDIERINSHSLEPNKLIDNIVKNSRK